MALSWLAWSVVVGLLVGGLLALSTVRVLAAGEDALYGPDAPEDSAYIRVFNGLANVPVREVVLGGKSLGSVAALSASDYVFLPPGMHELSTSV
ncbi:MAG: alginate O-acetyltransferase AlgF, partial [Gammaproteobacteria bacterium]